MLLSNKYIYYPIVLLFSIIINKTTLYYYPQFYKNALNNILYNIIYCYSNCELFYNKLFTKNIHKKIEDKSKILELADTIEIIQNGIIINILKKKNIYNVLKTINKIKYDIIIVSNGINKRIIYNDFDINKINDTKENSNIKIILTKINIIDDKENIIKNEKENFEIKFQTSKYNYFVEGNVINRKFINYFLNKYYKKKIKNYSITLIDNDINMNNINSNDDLIIFKYKYEIVKNE